MAESVDIVSISITAEDGEHLADITRTLVRERLAACGNIIGGVRSVYAWQGEIEDEEEALLILHTSAALVDRVVERVRELHPYDTPQVLAVPVVGALEGYRRWILDWATGEA